MLKQIQKNVTKRWLANKDVPMKDKADFIAKKTKSILSHKRHEVIMRYYAKRRTR